MNTKIKKSDLYVGIPAWNEESHIAGVIARLHAEGFENVAVVDDGSTDNTFEAAQKAGALVLRHPINCGAGAAVQTLIELARAEGWQYLQLIDADGQHFASDILRLINKAEAENLDLTIGSRFMIEGNEIPAIRRIFNRLGNVLTNAFCKQNFTDTQSGFRLLNRRAIEKIDLASNGFGFCSEMLLRAEKADLKIGEAPISVVYTEYSMSKGQTSLQNGFRTAWQFIEHL